MVKKKTLATGRNIQRTQYLNFSVDKGFRDKGRK